jgi:hypothetical protein
MTVDGITVVSIDRQTPTQRSHTLGGHPVHHRTDGNRPERDENRPIPREHDTLNNHAS